MDLNLFVNTQRYCVPVKQILLLLLLTSACLLHALCSFLTSLPSGIKPSPYHITMHLRAKRSDGEDDIVHTVEPSHEKTHHGVRFNVQAVVPTTKLLQLLTDD